MIRNKDGQRNLYQLYYLRDREMMITSEYKYLTVYNKPITQNT